MYLYMKYFYIKLKNHLNRMEAFQTSHQNSAFPADTQKTNLEFCVFAVKKISSQSLNAPFYYKNSKGNESIRSQ